MKPETLYRRIRDMDESISRLYEMWAELTTEVAILRARLGAHAPAIGLEVDRSTSPPRRPAGPEDGEAGGS